MNKENASKLWKIIQEAGDYLIGQLPDHPNHPKGRNPYAHVAICVKSKFDSSYKDIPDEQFDEVIKYIEFLKKLVKDKIEKEWSEKFVEDINLVLIPRMTIKRRYENKGIDLIKLIYDNSYYKRVKKNVNSRGNLEFGNR